MATAASSSLFVELEGERYGCTVRRPPKDYGTSPLGPLHLAAERGDVDELRKLLAGGSTPLEAKAKCGWTALHFAAREGHVDAVKVLIEAGCNLEAVDRVRSTPLHRAAALGHPRVLAALLDAGAPLEARDSSGQTALHVAAACGRLKAVDFLLDRGSSQNTRDGPLFDGMTAEEVARAAYEEEAIRLHLAAAPSRGEPPARQRQQVGPTIVPAAAPPPHELPEQVYLAALGGDQAATLAWLAGGGLIDARRRNDRADGLAQARDLLPSSEYFAAPQLRQEHSPRHTGSPRMRSSATLSRQLQQSVLVEEVRCHPDSPRAHAVLQESQHEPPAKFVRPSPRRKSTASGQYDSRQRAVAQMEARQNSRYTRESSSNGRMMR